MAGGVFAGVRLAGSGDQDMGVWRVFRIDDCRWNTFDGWLLRPELPVGLLAVAHGRDQ